MTMADQLLQAVREVVTHEIDIITEQEGWLEDYIITIIDKRFKELKEKE